MGQAIQQVLEDFYNFRIWERFPEEDRLASALTKLTEARVRQAYLRRKGPPDPIIFTEMLDTCTQGVLGFVPTLKGSGFWGMEMKPEVPLEMDVGDGVKIGGRVDFLVEPQDGGMILDGKNSQSKKNVDPDQLRWYGVLFKSHYGIPPKSLGFVWYRHPYVSGTPETGITWHTMTPQDESRMVEKAKKVRFRMDDHQFDPQPSAANCRFCDYASVCSERFTSASSGDFPEGPMSLGG